MSYSPALTDSAHLNVVTIRTIHREDVAQVILQGEADFSTLDELDAGLRQAHLDDATFIHLDVTGLEFADSAVIRRLALFARHVRETGRGIATSGANRTLVTVADQLGVRDDLGLV